MMIIVECTKCNNKMQIDEQYRGQQCKCPTCDAIVEIAAEPANEIQPSSPESDTKPEIVCEQIVKLPCIFCFHIFQIQGNYIGCDVQCPNCGKTFTSSAEQIFVEPPTFSEKVAAFCNKIKTRISNAVVKGKSAYKSLNEKFGNIPAIPQPARKNGLFPSALATGIILFSIIHVLRIVTAPSAQDIMKEKYLGFYKNSRVFIEVNAGKIVYFNKSNPAQTTIFYYKPVKTGNTTITAKITKIDRLVFADVIDCQNNTVTRHPAVANASAIKSETKKIPGDWQPIAQAANKGLFVFDLTGQHDTAEIKNTCKELDLSISSAGKVKNSPANPSFLESQELKDLIAECDQRAIDEINRSKLVDACLGTKDTDPSVKIFKVDEAIDLIGEIIAIEKPGNDTKELYALYNTQIPDNFVMPSRLGCAIQNLGGQFDWYSHYGIKQGDKKSFVKLTFTTPENCEKYYSELIKQQNESGLRSQSVERIPVATQKIRLVAKAVRPYKDSGQSVESLVNSGKISRFIFDEEFPPSSYILLKREINCGDDKTQLLMNSKSLLYNIVTSDCSLTPKTNVITLRSNQQVEDKKDQLNKIVSKEITSDRVRKITAALAVFYVTEGFYPASYKNILKSAGVEDSEMVDAAGTPLHILFPPADSSADSTIAKAINASFKNAPDIRVIAVSEPDVTGNIVVGAFKEENFNDRNQVEYSAINIMATNFPDTLKKLQASVEPTHKNWIKRSSQESRENIEGIAVGCVKCFEKNKQMPTSARNAVHYYNGGNVSKSRYVIPDRHKFEYILLDKPAGKENIIVIEPAGVREGGFWYANINGNPVYMEFSSIEKQNEFQNNLLRDFYFNASQKQMINTAKTYRSRYSYHNNIYTPMSASKLKLSDFDLQIKRREHLKYEILPAPVLNLQSTVKPNEKTSLVIFQPAESYECGVLGACEDGTLVWFTSKNLSYVPANGATFPAHNISADEKKAIVSRLIAAGNYEVSHLSDRKEQADSKKQMSSLMRQFGSMQRRGRLPNSPSMIRGWDKAKKIPNGKGEYILLLPPVGERKLILCSSPGTWSDDIQLGYLEKDGTVSAVELVSGISGREAQKQYIYKLLNHIRAPQQPVNPPHHSSAARTGETVVAAPSAPTSEDNRNSTVSQPVSQPVNKNTVSQPSASTYTSQSATSGSRDNNSAEKPAQIIPGELKGTELEKKLVAAYNQNKYVLLILYYQSNIEVRNTPVFLNWVNNNCVLLEYDIFRGDRIYANYFNASMYPVAILIDSNGRKIKEIPNYTDSYSWVNEANQALNIPPAASLNNKQDSSYYIPQENSEPYNTNNTTQKSTKNDFKENGRGFKNAGKNLKNQFKSLFGK